MQYRTKISGAAEAIVSALIVTNMRKATKFIGPNLVVKLTRRHKPTRGERSATFLLTIGKPNHDERKFIKDCRKAGEPLPVRKVRMKDFPKKRAAPAKEAKYSF